MTGRRNVNYTVTLPVMLSALLFLTSFASHLGSAYALSASFPLPAIEKMAPTTAVMSTVPPIQKSIPIILDGNGSSNSVMCHVAINPVTGRFYITASDGSLYVMKQQKNGSNFTNGNDNKHPLMQLSRINLGMGACASEMAINTRSNMIYIPNVLTDSLYVVDGQSNKLIKQISLVNDSNAFPRDPLFRAANHISMGINSRSNTVYVNFGIPTMTEEKIGSGSNATITRGYSYIYKTSKIDGNTNTVIDENLTGVEKGKNGITVDSGLGKVYFSNYDVYNYSHSITIMKEDDGDSTDHVLNIIKRIEGLVGDAQSMAVNPVNHKVYVDTFGLNSHKNIVNVIDGNTNLVTNNITLSNGTEGYEAYAFLAEGGRNWVDIAINPNTNTVYATNMFLGTLYVIDGATDKLAKRIGTPADNSQSSFSDGVFTAPLEVDADYSSSDGGIYIIHANSKALSLIERIEAMPEFGFALIGIAAAVAISMGIVMARTGNVLLFGNKK